MTTCGCGHDTKRRPGFLSAGSTLASSVARSGPDVDPAVSGVAVDRLELGGRELELVQGGNVLLELGDAASAEQSLGQLRALNPSFEHLKEFEDRVGRMKAGHGALAGS